MNQSQFSQASYRQDYVLTSYQNECSSTKNYLTPISPNMYLKNIGHNYLNVQNIYSCSPKQQIQMHKITPHPIFQLRESFNKNKHENIDLKNKQNYQQNLCVFDASQYEKLFEKKINFSDVGMSASKNSSPSIVELSNQSKKFIQESIKKSIDSSKSNKYITGSNRIDIQTINNLSQSQNELRKLFEQQNQQIKPRQTAQSYQTFEKGLILQIQYPSSSRNQTNIQSVVQINEESQKSKKQLQQQTDKKKSFDQISSFKQNQQIIDYFLTQEDDPNNSAEGIQLLSQLKSQLNSLINGSGSGSGSNSNIYSNQRSKHARTYNQIKLFKNKPNNVKVGFKRSSNACQQLACKLQELKSNIFALHQKMNASSNKNQPFGFNEQAIVRNNTLHESKKNVKQKQMEKQPEIYFKTDNKTNNKKLIYPDSRIIFSRNDQQFVQFDSQFSKIMNDSFNQPYQNHHTTSKYLQDQGCQQNSFNKSEKSSQIKSSRMRDSHQKSELENNSNDEYKEEQRSKFQSSQKDIKSEAKLTIQKQAFKLFYPNFYDLNNEREKKYSEREQQRQSQNLQKSCISSASNETFMKEMNSNFKSKLNKFDTLFN